MGPHGLANWKPSQLLLSSFLVFFSPSRNLAAEKRQACDKARSPTPDNGGAPSEFGERKCCTESWLQLSFLSFPNKSWPFHRAITCRRTRLQWILPAGEVICTNS